MTVGKDDDDLISRRLDDARRMVLSGIGEYARTATRSTRLRRLLLDYPLRPAKALRPALMFAAAEAFGACVEDVLPTAVALELCHNAFLLHDDVEDQSARRRHARALHLEHGVPVAINVGDGMFALALRPLLDNTEVLGLGRSLLVLELFSVMSRATVDGQDAELAWIAAERWDICRADYVRMVHRKTARYTFVTPILVGALAGGLRPDLGLRLSLAAARLGIAFQIADDLLSMVGDPEQVGKDDLGDLYEGKRTLVLLEALARASPTSRARALAILRKPRTGPSHPELADFCERHCLSTTARAELALLTGAASRRTEADARILRALVDETDAVAIARDYARGMVERAENGLRALLPDAGSPASRFLLGAGHFAVRRVA